MSEPQATPETPTVSPDAPPAAAEPAAVDTPPVAAAPAAATAPPAPPARPQPKRKPPSGPGGVPDRRVRALDTSLVDIARFDKSNNFDDLDAEIEQELNAAMSAMPADDLLAVDNSRRVQQAAGAPGSQGKKIGKIHSIHGQDVFIEIPGGRSQGVLPLEQFGDEKPVPGMEVEVTIEGYDAADGCLILSRKGSAVVANWSTVSVGMTVEARVLETNKGGLAVDINGIKGFMPISQIDLYRVEDANQFVNQKLLCIVTQAEPEQRNLVVSRRALLEKERDVLREKLWTELAVGQIRTGVVRLVKEFGAFVDLGGVDALLPISQMSWQRVNDPTKIVQPGQTIRVAIQSLDPETRKVSLSLKQLEPSPWDGITDKYAVGTVLTGKVTKLMEFGAFVELEPAVEGLVHITELSKTRVWRISDVVKPDQEVNVKVLSVDPEARRISLSIRQAIEEPVNVVAEDEEDEPEEPVKPAKPRATPLRGGGVGGSSLLIPPHEGGI